MSSNHETACNIDLTNIYKYQNTKIETILQTFQSNPFLTQTLSFFLKKGQVYTALREQRSGFGKFAQLKPPRRTELQAILESFFQNSSGKKNSKRATGFLLSCLPSSFLF